MNAAINANMAATVASLLSVTAAPKYGAGNSVSELDLGRELALTAEVEFGSERVVGHTGESDAKGQVNAERVATDAIGELNGRGELSSDGGVDCENEFDCEEALAGLESSCVTEAAL